MIVVALAVAGLFGAGLLGACSRPVEDPAAPSESSPKGVASARTSEGLGPSPAPSSASEARASASVEADALAELIAAAPKQRPPTTGAEGASLVGTETGEKPSKEPEVPKKDAAPSPSGSADAPPQKQKISVGLLSIQRDMASPSIEREARAQLYWPLVQRCRDKAGKILPADAILILFRIDEDGYIISSSISATPSKPEFEDAASCMRRELSVATFRAPPAARGMPTGVTMTAPSVD